MVTGVSNRNLNGSPLTESLPTAERQGELHAFNTAATEEFIAEQHDEQYTQKMRIDKDTI